MAFVNEKLTPEQREEFRKAGIKKPASNNMANPLYRTYDKEKNIHLWHIGNLGRDDFDHHGFLFHWNNENYFIIMQYSDPNPNSERIIWSISNYEKKFRGNEPFANDFREALSVYAVNGHVDQKGNVIVDVIFNRGKQT